MASAQLRARELRAIYRLIGECRELGDDPVVWRLHLFAGVGALISADVVGGGEITGGHFGPPQLLANVDWGWEAGFNREGWLRSVEWMQRDPLEQPIIKSLLQRLRSRKAVTLPRPRLLDDAEWYGSEAYSVTGVAAGIDAIMHSLHHVPGSRDDFNAVIPIRAIGRPNFNQHERRLLAMLHRELAPLIGGPLARFTEPSPSHLAPRVREVLRCLLEGDGDKQIAKRLNLSPYTVNEYTKTIFRHFGVSGRAELLARWIRRGWGARCEWRPRTGPEHAVHRGAGPRPQ